jgi:Skp family chaperone for outer membrane proteins
MKRMWWLGLVSGLVIGAVTLSAVTRLQAQARATGAGSIAVIDIVTLFNEYDCQKDLTEQMKTINQQMQDEELRRRGEIDRLQAVLDAMNINDPQLTVKQREMLQMQYDYKSWGEMKQADIGREVGLWTRRMYGEIQKATEEFAKQRGIEIVLYKDAEELNGYEPEAVREQIRQRKLIYSSANVDLTQVVLDKLNTDYRAKPKKDMLQITPSATPTTP